MNKNACRRCGLVALLLLWVIPAVLMARGDQIIPQVPDGTGADGTQFRTKFDLTNLGPTPQTEIKKVKLMFFLQDGSSWRVSTNLGTSNEFVLNLGAFQTLRIETQGTSPRLTSGYAIVRNLESTTIFAEDYEVTTSVFYEVKKDNALIDTVSVAVAQPTVSWVFPAEINAASGLATGFAVVNLSGAQNGVSFHLYGAKSPSSGTASDVATTTFTLGPNAQRAEFLQQSLFPTIADFKGMVLGYSDGPVAVLALLQSSTPTGVQYATMVPAYSDTLRHNTYMYLRQGYPLDADIPLVDYFNNSEDTAPWDLQYLTSGSTRRFLVPKSGARVAVLGTFSDPITQFDPITIERLQSLSYTDSSIDLSDGSANLAVGFALAVKTGLGHFVKIRIAEVITNGSYKDLALEIFVYR